MLILVQYHAFVMMPHITHIARDHAELRVRPSTRSASPVVEKNQRKNVRKPQAMYCEQHAPRFTMHGLGMPYDFSLIFRIALECTKKNISVKKEGFLKKILKKSKKNRMASPGHAL
jgi:hypothetical protein